MPKLWVLNVLKKNRKEETNLPSLDFSNLWNFIETSIFSLLPIGSGKFRDGNWVLSFYWNHLKGYLRLIMIVMVNLNMMTLINVIMIVTTKIIAIIILLYRRRQFAAKYCFVFWKLDPSCCQTSHDCQKFEFNQQISRMYISNNNKNLYKLIYNR